MIGTAKRNIIHYFPTTGEYKLFDLNKAIPGANGVMPGDIISIRFMGNKVLFCTQNSAWQWERGDEVIRPFVQLPKDYSSFVIKDVVGSDDTTFYFCTGARLLQWNRISGEAIAIKFRNDILPDGQKTSVSYLTKKNGNRLYLVPAFGWIAYLKNDTLEPVKLVANEDKELNGFFSSMDIDADGKIWLANTGVGLYSYDPRIKAVKYVDETDGLSDNGIQSAIVMKNGQVWCGAHNKFSVYDPASTRFYNFSMPLSEHNVSYKTWSVLLSDGNVLSSINNDLVEFFPERLSLKPLPATPLISLITVSGKDRLVNTEQLELEPDENYITIKFGLITDREIFPYSFEYMLEGFDKKWQRIESPEAVVNQLPAGKYQFRLVAYAKNGGWKSLEKTLTIIIDRPFYKAAWFYGLIGVLIVFLLFLLYRFRINKQKQILTLETKAQSLEKEKTLVQYQSLKQHLNPHFLFNSLTSLRRLIKTDTKTATTFLDGMSKVYPLCFEKWRTGTGVVKR